MDGDAIKSFFAHHVEKFVLGLIAAIAIFLIYSGSQYPDYLEKAQPERLHQDAQRVRQSIDDDHTEAIVETLPAKEVEEYPERVARLRNPIPDETYGPILYVPGSGESSVPRRDPQLFAPVELRVQGVLGALAMQSPRNLTSYPAMELEDAEPPEVEEEPQPRRSRRSSRRGRGMEGGGFDAEMEMGAGIMEEEEMMMGAEMGGPEGLETNVGQRRLNSKYNQGYKPTGGAGMATGRGGRGGDVPLKTVPQSSMFLAGTAAVPHKKLLESYKSALLDAAGYQAERDQPLYAGFEVQRADVTGRSVDELGEDDWILVGDWEQHNKMAFYQWDGFGAEIVPGDYRDPQLTAVIPPLLVYDFTRFATHPLIPLKSLQELAAEKQPERRVRRRIEGPILPGQRNNDPAASAPAEEGAERDSMRAGRRRDSIGDPEYKLVRFYDFVHSKVENSPKRGRDYVYRVRIGFEDPNFPKSPRLQPTLRNLAEDVFARVAPKVAGFESDQERDFVIYSDWSEPSPPASLPQLTEVYAGPVEPADVRTWETGGKSIDYVRSPAQGKAVGMEWDMRLATNVPAELTVAPGAVLNAKQAAEVIDPLTTVIKKTEERDIETDITVVDLFGGELLQITRETDEDEEMTAPGTMLMFDPEGGLSVRDDIDDLHGYRMHTFADEREAAKPSPSRDEEDVFGGFEGEMGGY